MNDLNDSEENASNDEITTQSKATLSIDGLNYELESLPESVISVVNSLQFLAIEIKKLDADLAIHQTAKNAYISGLREEITKMETSVDD
jgi:hypothetical protein